jgi:hypothetical protein
MVVCLASRSVVEADSGSDIRPRNDRVSELVELEGRVGREQYVATSGLGMAEGHERPPILDRELVEHDQQRIGIGGRKGQWQWACWDWPRIDDRELTREARPLPRK